MPTAAAKPEAAKLLTATVLGQHFELSANKMNYILSEPGWFEATHRTTDGHFVRSKAEMRLHTVCLMFTSNLKF